MWELSNNAAWIVDAVGAVLAQVISIGLVFAVLSGRWQPQRSAFTALLTLSLALTGTAFLMSALEKGSAMGILASEGAFLSAFVLAVGWIRTRSTQQAQGAPSS